jgi:hypothetical protein
VNLTATLVKADVNEAPSPTAVQSSSVADAARATKAKRDTMQQKSPQNAVLPQNH